VIVRNVIVRNAIVRNAIVRNATVGDAILRKFVIQSMVLGLVFMGLLSLAAGAAGPGNPAIQQFEADPGMVEAGNGSLLKWNVSGCAFVLIEPGSYLVQAYGYGNEYGDGALAPGEREIGLQGSMLVFPDKTTSYTLVAGNSEGNSTASTSVIVSALCSEACKHARDCKQSGHQLLWRQPFICDIGSRHNPFLVSLKCCRGDYLRRRKDFFVRIDCCDAFQVHNLRPYSQECPG
jgi:hypothetical protein